MSKNIDDVVLKIIPNGEYWLDQNTDLVDVCRDLLKQAIQDKKLAVPMSEVQILNVILGLEGNEVQVADVATAVYEAQFKRGEK